MIKKSRGFTLIELLVVVAIIGILASVVLSSLNVARNKGKDASIKQQLSGMRTSAALIYSNTGSYDTICDSGTNTYAQFSNAWNQAIKDTGESQCMSSGTTRVQTISGVLSSSGPKTGTPDAWAAVMHLQSGEYFCVDSLGHAYTSITRNIGGTNDVNCD
jgi:prepilin-type N-terminal cleavage/methylation domain-containing protein